MLLHEIGVLEELGGDEAAAARDLLGAVNAEPEFREPLERLISIIERRQSYKNLGKLLERLVKVAERPEEKARALTERAAYLADHEGELGAAREALEQALEEKNDDALAWLLLEMLAGKLGDEELRAHALAARAELAQDATWRALLLMSRAEVQLGAADADGALASLDQALERPSRARFLVLLALEDLGRRAERPDVLARALDSQAKLIVESMANADAGDALGVPRYRRSAAHAADAWVRAADVQRHRGDLAAATALLDQAIEGLPNEPAVAHARLTLAELSGDTATAARLARRELEAGATGAVASALWLRVAEAAASEGDGASALAALGSALSKDPGCLAARALELDLLAGADPTVLAAALEASAEQLPTDDGKARAFLLSADTWARSAGDPAGAKAALSQAAMLGLPPSLIARVSRLLAAVGDQPTWYEEATRRLLAQGAAEGEQPGLWYELVRSRLLRGELTGAVQALEGLAQTASGAWLGHALRAYAMGLVPEGAEGGDAARAAAAGAFAELARAETDPRAQRALRVVVPLRAALSGQRDEAQEKLEELHASDASDLVTATAFAAAARARGDHKRAAEALSTAAQGQEDAAAAALKLEAGILYWRAGERERAVDCFTAASTLVPGVGGVVLAWALRAANPDSLDARRKALDAIEDDTDTALGNLERFALEVGRGGDGGRAGAALAKIDDQAPPEIAAAAALARALWAPGNGGGAASRSAALSELERFGPAVAARARASAHQLALERTGSELDSAALTRSAAAWAERDDSAAAALEWLAHAAAARDYEQERAARAALAQRLGGDAGVALNASAKLLAWLHDGELGAPLEDRRPAAQLLNLELAPPGSDPRRRAAALLGLDRALGDESAQLAAALTGYNQLAQLEIQSAIQTFRGVVEAFPDEIIGWEGLRAAADVAGDRATVAEASAALGDAVSDDARGAKLWEAAALILLDELGDAERGEFALSRAVERDVRRFVSFDRLFRIVRSRKDGRRLLELIAKRLEVAEEPSEIAKLYWERARVLRESGDREGALTALENVTLLEPDHVGALALSGEIYITTRQFSEAAENLARLAKHDEAPVKQRLMSGVAAVDLYENKLGDQQRALEVLVGLYRTGLSTLPVRERLARAAAKIGAWEQASEVLEQLMRERDTRQARVEAARLCLAIRRDQLGQPFEAAQAAINLLREAPDDGEALDLLLSGALGPAETHEPLARGLDALVYALEHNPLDAERVDRVARIALELSRAPLRQAALGALIALGEGGPQVDRELAVLDQRVAHVPAIAIDESALPELCDPEDRGPIPNLMRELASTFAAALGPGLSALGVGKKERVDPRLGLPLRNEIAAWAGALGLGDFDLYLGGKDPHGVVAIPGERPALVTGSAVTAPLSAVHRQLVARELFALRRGSTIVRHRDVTEIAALVVAACKLGGLDLPSPPYAMLGEFMRLLGKEMPRRVKKLLPELAHPVVQSGQDPIAWTRAATSSLDRMAVIAAGDVSWVLGGVEGRGRLGASHEAEQRARRLLSFVLSPVYLMLRERLGMGVR
jgi:cellulose synthase operon protein C